MNDVSAASKVWKFEFDRKAPIWFLSEAQHTRESTLRSLKDCGLEGLVSLTKRDEVFTRILSERPTLILCDVDGSTETLVEFLKDLRVSIKFPSVPLLPLMNQLQWKKHQMSLFPYGIQVFAEKPVNPQDTNDRINKTLYNFQKSELERTLKGAKDAFSNAQFDQSQALFLEAKRVSPGSLPTEIGLINIQQKKGNFEESEKMIAQAQKLDKDSFSLQLLGVKALANMRTLSSRSQAMLEENLKNLIQLCHSEERWTELSEALNAKSEYFINSFEKNRSTFAKSPRALFEVSKCYFALKKEGNALLCAEEALNGGLQKVELYNLLGVLLRRSSQPQKALVHYDNAANLAPLDHRIHYNRGLNLEELGQQIRAIESYQSCLNIKPDFIKAQERIDHLKKSTPKR